MADTAKQALFLRQKETMDLLLAHGCLTRAQYDYSLTCLACKLGVDLPPREDKSDDNGEE